MIEAAAEGDDALTDKYLEAACALSDDEIKRGLKARALKNEIVLCMCGTAFKNKGVQALLDAVIEFMPSPIELPPDQGPVREGRDHHAHRDRRPTVLGAGLQDSQRSVRRQPHVLPRLFRHAEFRRHRVRADRARRKSASAACCRCTPTSATRSRKSAPVTSPRRWVSRTSTPATRCRISRRSSRSRR